MTKKAKATAAKGRPSKFTAALAVRICERLATGETLTAICRGEDMPSAPTVCRWALDAPFSEQYARAREIGYTLMADEIIDIADESQGDTYKDSNGAIRTDQEVVGRARLRVDTRK